MFYLTELNECTGKSLNPRYGLQKTLHSSWIRAGLKVNENRGHCTTRQKGSYDFGGQFNFKGCFKYVWCRYSVPTVSTRLSDLPGAVLCCSKAQVSSHMKTSRVCSSQCLPLWIVTEIMSHASHMNVACIVSLDHASSDRALQWVFHRITES